ncbi:MAG: DUF2513 domain-containing protein [Nitrospirota bacterium]|nr:DUF2513 domain-containing protein [Nitrospirota bacterium]MDE3224143.1 DUF2513 domain-containing protein [Nitrospirota bacterium]MDE3241726.1 DUF2513 domain-containing protein [Nitrospirota bacterium]
MKRDLELIRKLVLAAEASPTGYVKQDVQIEGYSPEQIGYHSYLLVDAGLAKGTDVTTFGCSSPIWKILHLTSAGHDFADAARDEGTWQKATGLVKDNAGGITLDVMKQLLISLMRKAIGL